MAFFEFIRNRNWAAVLGYLLFIGMMAVGYYYNITFIQIGLTDLGERLLGMSERQVAIDMGIFALIAAVVAILFGLSSKKNGWSERFDLKLRLAFAVVLAQTILTAAAPLVTEANGFLVWVILGSLSMGIGMPATFSMTVDLIPRRDRGYAAALITAGAYFAAEVFSTSWTFAAFRSQLLLIMLPGVLSVGMLAFAQHPIIKSFRESLGLQHEREEFARGRFVRRKPSGETRVQRSVIGLLILMFGIFFVDSLGFLRLLETPLYMQTAWQSSELNTRLFIAGTHVIAALIGGVIYAYLPERSLFLWIFGTFALTHLQYTFHIRSGTTDSAPLSMPMMYAIAVSLYTVVNFAIWADISTPKTIGVNTAIGVALSGWSATFISTALALHWRSIEMPLDLHIRIVDSLAILFFLGFAVLIYFQRPNRNGRKPQMS